MAVIVAVFLYILLQVDDVSAQTSCAISPNITTLTIANELTRDVEFHCQCMDNNRMMITTRWLSGGTSAPTQNFNIPPAVLLLSSPFDNNDAGTYTCSPNNMQNDPPSDRITLSTGAATSDERSCTIYSPSLTTNGGMMDIPSGTQNVILYCICRRANVAVGPTTWFINGTEVTRTTAGQNNDPYSRNNVPSPLIIPSFTGTSAGTYGCQNIAMAQRVTIDLAISDCVISPNLDALTIADGLTRDIEFHCQCTDGNGMMITGTRWFLSNGTSAPTQDLNIPPAVLLLAMPFTNANDGTYTCSPNSMSSTPPRDTITLDAGSGGGNRVCRIYSPSLTTAGGMMSIPSGTQNVILYCICRRGDITAAGPTNWFINGTQVTDTTASGNNPYSRNNVPAPLIIPSFTSTSAGTYGCSEVTNGQSLRVTINLVALPADVEPPTNVMATASGPRSVEVTWTLSSSSDVTGYVISYATAASYASAGSMMVSDSSATSGTLSNLEEGTLYTITVQATVNNEMSPNSDPASVTTYTDVPSSSPQNVMVTSVDSASLMVSWQPPEEIDHNGMITGYMINYTRGGTSDMMSVNVNSGTTETISGLVAYVMYSVRVAAVNVNGTGTFSDLMMQLSGQDTPSPPRSLMTVNVTDATVTLSWLPPSMPNGVITQYRVRFLRTDNNDSRTRDTVNNILMYTVTGLMNTEYTFEVRAFTRVGSGSYSDDTVTVFVGLPAPTIVGATVLTPRSAEVTWNQSLLPNVIFTGYLISYTTTASYTSNGSVMVNGGSTTSYILINLEEGTLYTITVQAVTNASRMSANSNAVSVTIYTDVPSSPPQNVTLTGDDPASLIVSWDPPLEINHNGVITGYVIDYTRVGSNDMMSVNGNSGTTYTISGLVAYVNYSVIVAAVNVNGTGNFSNRMVGRSGEDVPSAPRILDVSVNSSSVTLQWRPPVTPNGIITQYSIQFGVTIINNFGNNMLNMLMDTVEGLSPDTVYTLQLRAHTSVGAGPPSIETVTTYPGPILDVTVRNNTITSSGVLLTWMEISLTNSDLSHYTVFSLPVRDRYGPIMASNRRKRQSAQAGELTMNFNGTTGNLTNLNGAVTYRIQVAAIAILNGEEITGDRSNATELTTLEGVPTAPRDLNYMDLDDGGATFNVTLTWSRPDPPNGIIIQYNVSYIGTDSEGVMLQSFVILPANISSSTESFYRWLDLIRGSYQFSVVASTNNGSGDVADVMLSTLSGGPNTGGSSGGGSGAAVAGGVIGGIIAAIIIAIIVVVIVIFWRRRKGESSFTDKSTKVENSSVVPLKDITDGKSAGSYEPEIIGLPSELTAVEGQTFSFPSHVTGKPVPDVYWYLNSRDMTEDDVAVISSNGQLTLTSVSIDHGGEWRCQATNSSGSTEATTKLIIIPGRGKPLPSPRPDRKQKPIPVNEFGTHVTMLHESNNQGFKAEYESFYNGEGMSIAVGSAPANKQKNRFANIVAYDDNRVVLGVCGPYKDEYVNASPLDGYKQPRSYIAAQAPVTKTLADFWRLIWQEHPPTIVMVTNLKEGEKVKCVQYWPTAVGQTQTYGPLNVSLTEEFEFADYVVRTIELRNSQLGNQLHVVTQYHFIAWPDHGVPDYATAILAFHRRLRGTHHASVGPLLVHCSAGVGRTGTFLTIDMALEQIKAEGVVAIYNIVDKLRHQRPHMVQSQEQYMFIHDAILESITCGNTQVSAADLQRAVTKLKQRDPNTKLTGYEQQYKVLEQVSPRLEDQVSTSALKNPEKNRPNHCYPLEKGRVILRKEKSDYINASFLKGYKQDKAFIVAQSPMQNTVRDFWKMIHDRQCASVVMLCEIMEDGKEACAPYWPESGAFTYGDMTVTNINTAEAKEFTTRVFKVTDKGTNSTHQVTQFHFHSWGAHKTPTSPAGLLVLIEEVQRVQRSTANKPIVVHCSNVLGRTGTFCAIFTILDRFKVEQVIDVLQTVKLLRIKRPGIVQDLDQYQFLFSVVVRFLQSFDTYDNFKI